MPAFLYFIPSTTTPKQVLAPPDLAEIGLAYALNPNCGPGCCHTFDGPGGTSGVVATIDPLEGAGEPPLYKPEQQTWRKNPDGKYWVGVNNHARPGPDDLRRKQIYDGEAVALADGSEWIIPRCVAKLRGHTLPRMLDLADDGSITADQVHTRYEALNKTAERYFLQWTRRLPDDQHLTNTELMHLAVDALAVNYRVGKIEAVALLKLFDTDALGRVLRAMIDADVILEHVRLQAAADAEIDPQKKMSEPAASPPPG